MTAVKPSITQKGLWNKKRSMKKASVFIFLVSLKSSLLILVVDALSHGFTFIAVLAAYFILSILLQFFGAFSGMISWRCYPIVLLVTVIVPSLLIRTNRKVVYFDDFTSEVLTLQDLDRELWKETGGRVILLYQPELGGITLEHQFVTERTNSLDEIKAFFEYATGEPVQINLRFGHWDFGFRERSLHVIVGKVAIDS